ncbi:MAG: hypothetical protein SFW09_03600 [Hyphomicrobiaceae bacterium]|nr:hypothetical protein [Hyphomicrobiaceae bacterium]
MKLKAIALGVALALVAALPAAAQRGGGWELLGEERVGIGADRDVIRLSNDENFYRNKSYRRLRFVAEGGEVRMRSIRLVYLNGHAEEFGFEQNLAPGQEIDMDLRGERSYLRQIEMNYKAKFGLSIGGGGLRIAQPTIKVFGENVRGGVQPPPRPTPPPPAASGVQWDTLGRERFDRRDERVEFRIGRDKGRYEVIRFQLAGSSVTIRDVNVRFANGTNQTFRLNQDLSHEEVTRTLDLEGEARTIERVIVNLDPKRRPGSEILGLAGGVRSGPGRPGRGDLVPLGQADVGFRVDRDVIRVGQSEDWFRNRGFDKLHFIAENNDVHMMSVRIVYLNGHAEDYAVDRLIRAGGDLILDLRGRRSYIREIEMVYRKREGFGGRALVRVLGEPPR